MTDGPRDAVELRAPVPADLEFFVRMEEDPESRHMAAFGATEPTSRAERLARWERMVSPGPNLARTVLWNGDVVGYAIRFELSGKPSVAYWIDRPRWGRGIATRALAALLGEVRERPLYARVAKDNAASRTVLERCGFVPVGEERSYAVHRGTDIEELIYRLA